MPGITLTLSGSPNSKLTRQLVSLVTNITCAHLIKDTGRVMMIIRYVPQEQWYIAGKSLMELKLNSFRLEVTITDETATLSQKTSFAHAAFQEVSTLIGNVHPHSNIYVIDCRASAYSYGGITQANYIKKQAVAA